MARLRTILGAFALAAVALRGEAQPQAAQRQADTLPTRVDPRSPRAIVEEFLSLTRRGQFGAAGRFLAEPVTNRVERARQLKAILDQHLSPDLDLISPLANGDDADGLPDRFDQIGAVRTRSGVLQPIRLQRQDDGAEPAWLFAPATVSKIPSWYDLLGAHWLRERMPLSLQQPSLMGVDRWQWVLLISLLIPALILGWFAGTATVAIGRRAVKRTRTTFDDRLLKRIAGPLRSFWAVVAYRVLVEFVGLSISAEQAVSLGVKVASVVLVTWLLLRTTHVLEEELPSLQMGGHAGQIKGFAPLIGRVARIFIFAFGAIAIVAQFGYTVTTLLTGLGIGGIALAFAAQKTLEHPFGSIALGLDQPIRIGDWVKVGETEGEVESIGLRSTRLRTMQRTLVVFPNGRLAEQQMENFGVRDRILLKTILRLRYDTKPETIKRIRDDIEELLVEHPLVWPDRIIVRFRGFGDSSLDIDIVAWLATTDYNIFRAAREEIYFKVMNIIAAAGATMVNNVQTLVVQGPAEATTERASDLSGGE